jgi:predicted nucleic acid-binding protein
VIYLDSCLVIYLVEQHAQYGDTIARLVEQEGTFAFAISPLVKCECLVGPLRRGNSVLQQEYLEVFREFVLVDMPEPMYLRAAELRARFGVKLPDALHLACAQHHHCDAFWTNDDRLARAPHGLVRSIFAPGINPRSAS